jgi:hypothetical protein
MPRKKNVVVDNGVDVEFYFRKFGDAGLVLNEQNCEFDGIRFTIGTPRVCPPSFFN